jgi:glycosidase
MNWYSVFIRSFADGNKDGIGDILGLTNKLDYIKELGIEGIWLLPIHQANSYHKYDVLDYLSIDKEYGSLEDFSTFLEEAHNRDIKVIIDFVANHTSNQHPWFLEAIKSKSNSHRNWYVWKPSILRTKDEQNVWHLPEYGAQDEVYYGLFWSGMPDLNFDFPPLRNAIKEVAKFWLDKGVDGFRLDAAMHIYPPYREKDNQVWWKEFSEFVREIKNDCILVGEVTADFDFITPYFKSGLSACFNFELAGKIIKLIEDEKHNCFAAWIKEINETISLNSHECFDAIFLSNHDQTRIATSLNSIDKTKLAASILLTLPGDPFIYYGEEIGMLGDKPDEQIREPFLWTEKSKDTSRATIMDSKFSVDETINPLSIQESDPDSIYWHYKNLLNLRKDTEILSKGIIGAVHCEEMDVLLFTRTYLDKNILVAHNVTGNLVHLLNEDEEQYKFDLLYASSNEVHYTDLHFVLPPYSSLILWCEKV